MATQTAVLFGLARVGPWWLAVPRAYLRRLRHVAMPRQRAVDIGADPGRYALTAPEMWQRVQAAPVIGKVGHSRKYAGGAAHPTTTHVPVWVTPRGANTSLLQRVQLAHQIHHNHPARDEYARRVPPQRGDHHATRSPAGSTREP